jgi:hypothetical protein
VNKPNEWGYCAAVMAGDERRRLGQLRRARAHTMKRQGNKKWLGMKLTTLPNWWQSGTMDGTTRKEIDELRRQQWRWREQKES